MRRWNGARVIRLLRWDSLWRIGSSRRRGGGIRGLTICLWWASALYYLRSPFAKSHNPLQDFQKRPEASKRGFDTFHNRATFRGLRYDLLLAQIYKNANEEDPDREYVKQAMEVIKQQALDANEGIAETKAKVALREYQKDLVYKSGDSLVSSSGPRWEGGELETDLATRPSRTSNSSTSQGGSSWRARCFGDLMERDLPSGARLISSSWITTVRVPPPSLVRRSREPLADLLLRVRSRHHQTTARARWSTEVQHQSTGELSPSSPRVELISSPPPLKAVPLDLIQLKPSSFSEPPVPKSSGFHLRSAKFTGTERHPSSNGVAPGGGYVPPTPSSPLAGGAGGAQESSLAYPIHFHQMGRFNGPVYYYVESAALRSEWEKRLREAIALRSQRQEANRVVRLDPLADQTFGITSTAVGSLTPNAPATNQFGRPTCSVPLTTADGQSLVIATCSEGLFIGVRGRPNSMRKVLHLPDITQCAVLPEFGFVLVVANRVLIACELLLLMCG